jgi:rSAM/selenodomain-associated transferase 2
LRPSLGIVVPIYNEAPLLADRLHALARLPADAVVYVDGGSADASPSLLEAAGVRWLSAPRGRASQMNAGAAHVDTDILLFLHIDTELCSSHLEDVCRALADAHCVGGRFDLRLSGRPRWALAVVAAAINLRSRLSRISTGDQAMFVRRSVFTAMGGFAALPLMEDVEFSRRLKRRGRIACLRHRVSASGRRWERHGLWRTVALMGWLRLRYWLGADPAALARLYRDTR